MQLIRRLFVAVLTLGIPFGISFAAAHAQSPAIPASLPVLGAPADWQMTLQPPHSPVKADMVDLNHLVLIIIGIISAFVAGLLVWVIWRYNAKRNPVPSQTTHNTVIEISWTVLPVLILVLIAIPSFRLVYYEDKTYDPDLTIKVTGHQWYWEYTYPDKKNLDFSSYIIPDDKLKPGDMRLLSADNPLVLPVGKNIRILQTSGDVIHSFFIPALGLQRYAIPGRTIETWVRIDQAGRYYGECNQICGTNHSRMPIDIVALPQQQFDAWVTQAQKQFAADAAPAEPPIRQATSSGASAIAVSYQGQQH
ncbi:MAG TPA: cytochrome c oxidase subunit II [Acetobacteraceae bacterium]|nr:cytochrome c oxidase subunit II [Acetobacteraceae bacterium]